jgi:hypothetical protein
MSDIRIGIPKVSGQHGIPEPFNPPVGFCVEVKYRNYKNKKNKFFIITLIVSN